MKIFVTKFMSIVFLVSLASCAYKNHDSNYVLYANVGQKETQNSPVLGNQPSDLEESLFDSTASSSNEITPREEEKLQQEAESKQSTEILVADSYEEISPDEESQASSFEQEVKVDKTEASPKENLATKTTSSNFVQKQPQSAKSEEAIKPTKTTKSPEKIVASKPEVETPKTIETASKQASVEKEKPSEEPIKNEKVATTTSEWNNNVVSIESPETTSLQKLAAENSKPEATEIPVAVPEQAEVISQEEEIQQKLVDLVGTYEYDIFIEGDKSGFQIMNVKENNGVVTMRSSIEMAFSVLFIFNFKYEHLCTEEWQNGQLHRMNSYTDQNGEVLSIALKKYGDKLKGETPDGMVSLDIPVTTNNAWNLGSIIPYFETYPMIDPSRGFINNHVLEKQPDTTVKISGKEVSCIRYNVKNSPWCFWVDPETGILLKQEDYLEGYKVEIIMRNP